MFKRAAQRFKAWSFKPVISLALRPLPATKHRTPNSLFQRHFGDTNASGANQPKQIQKTKTETSVPVNLTKETKATTVANGVTPNNHAAQRSFPPMESLKSETSANSKIDVTRLGYFQRFRPISGKGDWWFSNLFIAAVVCPLATFALYVWQEDLYVKYRLSYIAQHSENVESLLSQVWLGLKNDVPIKVNGKETPLPKWGWVWYLRRIPGALFTSHPLDEIASNSELRYQQSKATITPIDFSPVIERVLGMSPNAFVIVDGQKGSGKSTAMMLLCWHEIRNGRPALFLRLTDNSTNGNKGFMAVKVIRQDPSYIETLAEMFGRRNRRFTIVVDDMHRYLSSADTHKNAKILVGFLWQATETYGARVIFPTSGYGLKQAILDLPLHHSARFEQVRMYAPDAKQLTEMINSGIEGKGHQHAEGNSPTDIARYCEVVGTLRSLLYKYLRPGSASCSSVREVTQTLFNSDIQALPKLLEKVMSAKGYTPNDVNAVLETLCKEQYVDPNSLKIQAICETLAEANITRPVCGLDGRYEFHSFQIEVAIRAVLDMPATLKSSIVQKNGEPESTGRGSSETITALKPGVKNFEEKKTIAKGLLGRKVD